jgi:hypothetical protein
MTRLVIALMVLLTLTVAFPFPPAGPSFPLDEPLGMATSGDVYERQDTSLDRVGQRRPSLAQMGQFGRQNGARNGLILVWHQ